ncbi:MAG TPA: hypothetical protein VHE53_01600 [Patescibacteria group bacterium]|nr:hypothetical protein [Patescibacteria group bacterium]
MTDEHTDDTHGTKFEDEDIFDTMEKQFGAEFVYHGVGFFATIGLLLIGGLIFGHKLIPVILPAAALVVVGTCLSSFAIGGILHALVNIKDNEQAKQNAAWSAAGMALILVGIFIANFSLTGRFF